jgi:hypothetical protein
MMAWKPDFAIPSAQVMTGSGVLPVLGTKRMGRGDTVYRFGRTTGEQPGKVTGYDTASQYVEISAPVPADHGDSGGPVYVYVKDARGDPIGVKAVGMTEAVRDGKTYVLPIARAEGTLHVKVLKHSSKHSSR